MSPRPELSPAPGPAPRDVAALRRALCAWFAAHARDLPWRRTRDPYAVWISEAMLQQTRVEAVLDHYRRFLARFPDVAALAAASEDEVKTAWSGLGYYRRAVALREAARAIVADHGGELPRTREAMLALPGVGRYTAGAVLSIAFGASEPLVDGNVARVFSRLFLLEEPLGTATMERALWTLAATLVPPAPGDSPEVHPGAWNQGLMELGALVCLPGEPKCAECPLADRCAAHATGRAAALPVRRPRRTPVDVRLEILVVRRGTEVLVVRRPRTGRMAGLWELPTRELGPADGAVHLWPGAHALSALTIGAPLGELAHSITHHRIRATVRGAECLRSGTDGVEAQWIDPRDAAELALTGMAKKTLLRFG